MFNKRRIYRRGSVQTEVRSNPRVAHASILFLDGTKSLPNDSEAIGPFRRVAKVRMVITTKHLKAVS